MHTVRQRLFRHFVHLGGDLADDTDVKAFVRCVEGHFALLPPKVKAAFELAWLDPNGTSYLVLVKRLRRREGGAVTQTTVRQRLSRGGRLIEQALATRSSWDGHEPLGPAGVGAAGGRATA